VVAILDKAAEIDRTAAVSTLDGRKRRDDIWVYFKYNAADDKTECIVTGHGGKCGHKVGRKNTTNLKRRLKARHKIFFRN